MQKGILTEKIFKNKYSKLVFIILAIYLIFILFFNIKINMADRKFINTFGNSKKITYFEENGIKLDLQVLISKKIKRIGLRFNLIPIIYNEYMASEKHIYIVEDVDLILVGTINEMKFNFHNFNNLLPEDKLNEETLDKFLKLVFPIHFDDITSILEKIKKFLEIAEVKFDEIVIDIKRDDPSSPYEYFGIFKIKDDKYCVEKEEATFIDFMQSRKDGKYNFLDIIIKRKNNFQTQENYYKKNIGDKKYYLEYKIETTFRNSYSQKRDKKIHYFNNVLESIEYFDEDGNFMYTKTANK